MTVEDTYIVKSAQFTPSGGTAQAITGLQNFSIRQGGQVVAHSHDGNVAVTAHFQDDLEGEVTIETTKANYMNDADLEPGKVGSLVIVMQKRAAGKGAAAGSDVTLTAAQAMVGQHDGSVPHSDRSNLTIPFHCSDPDGAAPFAWS